MDEADLIAVLDRHAEVVWCALIGAGLGLDVWLLRSGRRLLSDAARTRSGRCAQALLVAHFAGLLGPADPFSLAAQRLSRRL